MKKANGLVKGSSAVLMAMLFAVMTGCWAEEVKQLSVPPQAATEESVVPPLDGIRHGATKEVFDRVVTILKEKNYQLRQLPEGGGKLRPMETPGSHCVDFLSGIRKGEASYVIPTVVTDDYNDPRLEPYKEKYHEVQSKSEWTQYPGYDWFGGILFTEDTVLTGLAGTVLKSSRNFAVYDLPLGKIKENIVIFYGEFDYFDSVVDAGRVNVFDGSSHYVIYKDMKINNFIQGVQVYRNIIDEKEKKKIGRHRESYSIIFGYHGKYYIAYVNAIDDGSFLVSFDQLGYINSKKGKDFYTKFLCEIESVK